MKLKTTIRSIAWMLVLLVLSTSLSGCLWPDLSRNTVILEVNDRTIENRIFRDRIRFESWRTAQDIRTLYNSDEHDLDALYTYAADDIRALRYPEAMGIRVLVALEKELAEVQVAESLGITIDEAALAEQSTIFALKWGIGIESENNPDTALGLSPAEFCEEVATIADISPNTVRDFIYYQAVQNTMLHHIGDTLPREELRVNSRHILLAFGSDFPRSPTADQKIAALEQAEVVLDALAEGQSFSETAAQYSADPGSAQSGSALDWANPDDFPVPFRDALIAAEIDVIIGPIETWLGYHIILVDGREIQRLTDEEWLKDRQEAFEDWQASVVQTANIVRVPDWFDYVPNRSAFDEFLGDIFPPGWRTNSTN